MSKYKIILKEKILELEADLQAYRSGFVAWSDEEIKTMTGLLIQMKRDLQDLNWSPEALKKQ